MKGMGIEVRRALTCEHIGKNLVAIWRADTDAVPAQQPCWQRMFKRLVENLLWLHLCFKGLAVDYQGQLQCMARGLCSGSSLCWVGHDAYPFAVNLSLSILYCSALTYLR